MFGLRAYGGPRAMRIVRLGVSGRRGSGAPAVARVHFDAQRLVFRGCIPARQIPRLFRQQPLYGSSSILSGRWRAEPALRVTWLLRRERRNFFVCPSDRDVSKLKQVAPVVAGQQSVGAVALRATAEQD